MVLWGTEFRGIESLGSTLVAKTLGAMKQARLWDSNHVLSESAEAKMATTHAPIEILARRGGERRGGEGEL